ncbi:LPXTG cell wall anchor domain-containing protein [Streptomyces sp. PLAI1-29]|uniref:LPXTG cell wall anchor domain-containing protein n=1 Tax=Streptomyces zingiberis TaxID=2053010 RepID=A0ABX1BSP0_9ACTN|nr:LPXTG cell wall anchor domain-containing protein [Streptomyces zingiberis]
MPGKIVAGSGWHTFELTFTNPSSSELSEVDYFAGVGPADENAEYAFDAKLVVLEVFDEDERVWVPVDDGSGHSVGWIGWGDLAGEHSSTFEMRLNVKAGAPVGAGLTIGAGIYLDEDGKCFGVGENSFDLEIVAPGTKPGNGPGPQTGGKTPVSTTPTEKPSRDDVPQVQGSLAETGSSSALPMIAVIGGVAMAAGAGTILVVRRRRAGDLGAVA